MPDHTTPEPASDGSATPPQLRWLLMAGLVATAGIAVGSLGPWAVGARTVSGTNGPGTLLTILAAVAAVAIVLIRTNRDRSRFGAQWIVFGAGFAATAIAVINVIDVGSADGLTIGWGLWLVLLSTSATLGIAATVVANAREA